LNTKNTVQLDQAPELKDPPDQQVLQMMLFNSALMHPTDPALLIWQCW
jgi:hypothetical protein